MEDSRVDEKAKQLLGILSQEVVEPSPYSKTRIVAEVMARRTHKKSHSRALGFWKLFALGGSAAGIATIAALFWIQTQSQMFKASIHQAMVIKVDVQDLKQLEIAKAKIVLPDGVEFFLEDLPELSSQRELMLNWSNANQRTHFAFVIRATQLGVKELNVKFMNANQTEVATKTVKVKFEDRS